MCTLSHLLSLTGILSTFAGMCEKKMNETNFNGLFTELGKHNTEHEPTKRWNNQRGKKENHVYKLRFSTESLYSLHFCDLLSWRDGFHFIVYVYCILMNTIKWIHLSNIFSFYFLFWYVRERSMFVNMWITVAFTQIGLTTLQWSNIFLWKWL